MLNGTMSVLCHRYNVTIITFTHAIRKRAAVETFKFLIIDLQMQDFSRQTDPQHVVLSRHTDRPTMCRSFLGSQTDRPTYVGLFQVHRQTDPHMQVFSTRLTDRQIHICRSFLGSQADPHMWSFLGTQTDLLYAGLFQAHRQTYIYISLFQADRQTYICGPFQAHRQTYYMQFFSRLTERQTHIYRSFLGRQTDPHMQVHDFNVSFTVEEQSHNLLDSVQEPELLNRKESRGRIEPTPSRRLPTQRQTAKPNRLTVFQRY